MTHVTMHPNSWAGPLVNVTFLTFIALAYVRGEVFGSGHTKHRRRRHAHYLSLFNMLWTPIPLPQLVIHICTLPITLHHFLNPATLCLNQSGSFSTHNEKLIKKNGLQIALLVISRTTSTDTASILRRLSKNSRISFRLTS